MIFPEEEEDSFIETRLEPQTCSLVRKQGHGQKNKNKDMKVISKNFDQPKTKPKVMIEAPPCELVYYVSSFYTNTLRALFAHVSNSPLLYFFNIYFSYDSPTKTGIYMSLSIIYLLIFPVLSVQVSNLTLLSLCLSSLSLSLSLSEKLSFKCWVCSIWGSSTAFGI